MDNRYIDMHVHTNNSDGSFSPTEVINLANLSGTKILSICDHDSISGLKEFKENIIDNMIGIKGIEFSSFITIDSSKIRIHMLGYCFDETNERFNELLNEMQEKRRIAHNNVIKTANELIGNLPETEINKLNFDKYCWFDRNVISVLEKSNFDKEKIDVLRKYYKEKRFSYGKEYDLDVLRVIDSIHSAGGYAVFAHPMAYNLDKLAIKKIIKKLINYGIDGIEIYQSDCDYKDSMYLKNIVEKNGLLWSVGSDFHRFINADQRIISRGIDDNLCIQETTLSNKILEKKLYFERGEK